ncbi:MAG: sugar transferase [Coriobacteriia bacterium]
MTSENTGVAAACADKVLETTASPWAVAPETDTYLIDELPQLLSVFVGQMSLIGLRPGLPREVALYDECAMRRLAVKPGCCGPWQVYGRSDLGFEEMVDLDLNYIEKRSIGQNLSLVFKTLGAMLSGDGAA